MLARWVVTFPAALVLFSFFGFTIQVCNWPASAKVIRPFENLPHCCITRLWREPVTCNCITSWHIHFLPNFKSLQKHDQNMFNWSYNALSLVLVLQERVCVTSALFNCDVIWRHLFSARRLPGWHFRPSVISHFGQLHIQRTKMSFHINMLDSLDTS